MVFNTSNGVVNINPGEMVTSIQSVDNLFVEIGDASADFDISGSQLTLKSAVRIPAHAASGQSMGIGYIITLASR